MRKPKSAADSNNSEMKSVGCGRCSVISYLQSSLTCMVICDNSSIIAIICNNHQFCRALCFFLYHFLPSGNLT